MFGTPERVTCDGISQFYVPVKANLGLGVELEFSEELPHPDLAIQSKFETIQEKVLQELTRQKTIFKGLPTYDSLKSITPNWGCVIQDGKAVWSPYTHIITKNVSSKPALVDLVLRGVYISRSTIRPQFEAVFRKEITQSGDDLEWDETVGGSEITEVYDMPSESGTLLIKDPAALEREKRAAKERISEAFRVAAAARETAERAAEEFYAKYDLSDSESAFSEWMSDTDDDDD